MREMVENTVGITKRTQFLLFNSLQNKIKYAIVFINNNIIIIVTKYMQKLPILFKNHNFEFSNDQKIINYYFEFSNDAQGKVI